MVGKGVPSFSLSFLDYHFHPAVELSAGHRVVGRHGLSLAVANCRQSVRGNVVSFDRRTKKQKKRQRKGVHAQLAAAKRAGASGLQQGLAKVRRFVGVGGDDVAAKIGAMRSEASAF